MWIQTYSGKKYEPLHPNKESIDIVDIAHSLSLLCRFNGHCDKFYSVAEHCVLVSQQMPEKYAIHGLLHDAGEAYLSDIPRPIKRLLPNFTELEEKALDTVYERYGIVYPKDMYSYIDGIVHGNDLRMLATEKEQLITLHNDDWGLKIPSFDDVIIQCWSPEEAEKQYLKRFHELTENKYATV